MFLDLFEGTLVFVQCINKMIWSVCLCVCLKERNIKFFVGCGGVVEWLLRQTAESHLHLSLWV